MRCRTARTRKVDGNVGGVWPVAGWAQVDRGRVATGVELREPVRAASQPPHLIGQPVGDGVPPVQLGVLTEVGILGSRPARGPQLTERRIQRVAVGGDDELVHP